MTEAYPRGRGGTRAAASRRPGLRGLSPRARGNRHREGDAYRPGGPIPAGAGEPDSSRPPIWRTMAYPRGRGGTEAHLPRVRHVGGLSPRARGNPKGERAAAPRPRPIPAGAGEPREGAPSCRYRRAYPRGRGGTYPMTDFGLGERGLSPRARGNQRHCLPKLKTGGPIPAGAGEPCRAARPCGPAGAYPRGRGGTRFPAPRPPRVDGLSPRARGNPDEHERRRARCGPIPAGAGEPTQSISSATPITAYPRGRGGTEAVGERREAEQGLSPRARGNHKLALPEATISGPIPAGAGEPGTPAPFRDLLMAYPRGRGGTTDQELADFFELGLSPRARGNRPDAPAARASRGPIPAGAGEPNLHAGRG